MQKKEIYQQVRTTINALSKLDVNRIQISDYSKKYVKDYVSHPQLYASLYAQLMLKCLQRLNKPIEQSTFIDYGGGCGLLSLIAKRMNFKTVVYNDIYDVSVNDAQTISKELNLQIDCFIEGDIDNLLLELKKHNIAPDILSSFNVLEHIYQPEKWFQKVKNFQSPFSLCFMTSANGKNPIIRKRLQKIHQNAEFVTKQKSEGWKERDVSQAFIDVRKEIIRAYNATLEETTVHFLAQQTRGLRKEEIIQVVQEYQTTGLVTYQLPYLTNTCDPYTGNWAEHIIDLKRLKLFLTEQKFTQIKFTNTTFGYTENKILSVAKFFINGIIRILGKETLFLSPSYILELEYKK